MSKFSARHALLACLVLLYLGEHGVRRLNHDLEAIVFLVIVYPVCVCILNKWITPCEKLIGIEQTIPIIIIIATDVVSLVFMPVSKGLRKPITIGVVNVVGVLGI